MQIDLGSVLVKIKAQGKKEAVSDIKSVGEAADKTKDTVKKANSDIEKSNDKIKQSYKQVSQTAQSEAESIKKAFGVIKGIIAGYTGKKLYEALIGSNADYEQTLTSMEVLLGNAEKAEKMIKNLDVMGAKTPFELSDLTKATNQLLAFGTAEEDIMTRLNQLGDLSMGNAAKLDRITAAYGKMLAKGKVSLEELNMFTEAGIPIIESLSKQLDVGKDKLFEMITDGKIGIEEINNSMAELTGQGGKFFGMMAKQSQTFAGMMSTMSDNVNIFARQVGDEAFNYIKAEFNDLMEEIEKMSDNGELEAVAKDIGEDIANIIKTIISLVEWLYKCKDIVIAGASAFVVYKTTFATITTAAKAYAVVAAMLNIIRGKTVVCTNLETGATIKLTAAEYAEAVAKDKQIVKQSMFNAVLNANPYMVIISLLAAVVGGIIAYTKATDSAIESAEKLNETYKENIKSINDRKNSDMAAAEQVKTLRNRLFELDDQLGSDKLSTEETAAAKEEMSSVVASLNEIIPDLCLNIDSETGRLNNQRSSVIELTNAYIRLTTAKAMAAAYEEKINTAAKTIADANDIMKKEPKKLSRVMHFQGVEYEIPSKDNPEYLKASKTKKQAEKDLLSWTKELNKYQNEVLQLSPEEKPITTGSSSGGSGGSKEKSKSGTKSSPAKSAKADNDSRLKEYKSYIDDVIKEDERLYNVRSKYEDISAEDEAQALKERAKMYADFNSDIVKDTALTADQKAELIKENNDKIEELQAEAFSVLKAERQKHMNELAKLIESDYNEIISKTKEKQNAIISGISAMRSKLKEFSGGLFSSSTVTIQGGGTDGSSVSYTKYSLTNFKDKIAQIRNYKSILTQLKHRNIPQGIFKEIRDMSIDEAVKFGNELLKLSDDDLNGYIYDYNEYEFLSGSIAQELYSSDIAELQNSWNSGIKDMLDNTPDYFFETGKLCIKRFSEGLGTDLNSLTHGITSDSNGDGRDDITGITVNQNFYGDINSPSAQKRAAIEGIEAAEAASR